VDPLTVIGRIARSTVVDAVADRIKGEILSGRLEPGARLPSERELALALGINRLTLRAALGRLEAIGLVATRHGAGTLVTSWRERAGLDALGALASVFHPDDPASLELLRSILELRRILAAEAIALAAERHTPEDLAAIERIVLEQQANVGDPIAMARGDVRFQRAIIRAAGNVAFELILNSFARFPDEHPDLVQRLYEQPEKTLAHYPLIVAIIRARDVNLAREAIRKALEGVDEELLSRQTRAVGPRPRSPFTLERGGPAKPGPKGMPGSKKKKGAKR
jgi:GntR family transcriptional repressor for pyruvate dehydrogenase complex